MNAEILAKGVHLPRVRSSFVKRLIRLFQEGTAVISVAAVLSFAGLISMTEVQRFVPWPTNILGVVVIAMIGGTLLALMSPRAAWLVGFASALSVIFLAAFWTYSTWSLVGAVFSLADPVTTNLLILYLFPRGFILFTTSILSGVLTVVSVQFLLPDQYQPDDAP